MERDYMKSLSKKLYNFCKSYVDRYNGENNCAFTSNGELRLMTQTLGDSRIVFDVGANIGEWAALALEINPSLELHCFEPSKATYRLLLAKKFPAHVVCNNYGLGARQEEGTLYVFEDGSGLNSLYERHGLEDGFGLSPQKRTETIYLDTLDHYCQEHDIYEIDFIKVDVEGHELEVLRGASQMLKEGRIKIIQFEYGGCNIDSRLLLKDIFEFVSPQKYCFYKVHPKELRQIERYDQRLENFQYSNWAIIRRD
jgi:FkbM family methyltransferase